LSVLLLGLWLSGAAAEESWMPVVVKIDTPGFGPTAPLAPGGAYGQSRIAPLAGWKRSPTPSAVVPAFRAGPPAVVLTETRAPGLLSYAMTTGSLPEPGGGQPLVVAAAADPPARDGSVAAADLPRSDLARKYCVAIAATAAEARIAWQKAKLAETEQQIDKRIAALEAKTAEYKTWLDRRDEFARKANKTLVQIYARMEPDAAALQLVSMDEETAAAVLTKLDPRNSSAILNEMQPAKAARLASTIAGAARVPQKKPVNPEAAQRTDGDDEAPPVPNAPGGRT
jgi:flagellar motility protein MotE (MotC chaperone)